jgi:hypothetical protein
MMSSASRDKCSSQASTRQKLNDKITIAYRIETVSRKAFKPEFTRDRFAINIQ